MAGVVGGRYERSAESYDAHGLSLAACAGGQPPSKHPDSDGVQQAIRFEKAKAAAGARQAQRNSTTNAVG